MKDIPENERKMKETLIGMDRNGREWTGMKETERKMKGK